MSSSTTTPCTPSTPNSKARSRSSISSAASTSPGTSTHSYKLTPKSLTLTRSFSISSSSSSKSPSQTSSPSLEPPSLFESHHSGELLYRRMPDSPKPHYFYERPGFFTPKRSAPKAPGSPRAEILLLYGEEFEEEDE
ncbi:hypothetical protein MFRU_005g01510 [Monilinia fructicola]|uniref:Uncharacterized protein n=1 Tax=Monilinia fructicola TaxID=38448 RepID=A0A5M9JL27_MONFR|nr:hypothetical protein EYC84_002329 [Monilinia fructicola]KAG4033134.1 hypothetical protein MFRU_005g01510 [Monilinia fructicola]